VRPCVALLATAVVAALLTPGAAEADTSIGALAAPTPVRAWAGTAVLSVLDPATGSYRLATQAATNAPQPLPGIAPAAQPFDADIGPGPGGVAMIVFARCQTASHCHLARTTAAGGTETPIAGSAATDGWESADRLGRSPRLRAPVRHRLAARLRPPAGRRQAGAVRPPARRASA
jgi:hypothetical protein